MKKIVYFCPKCKVAFANKPELQTLANPHPHNLCPCGIVLRPEECIVKEVSYEELKDLNPIDLHPNWLG